MKDIRVSKDIFFEEDKTVNNVWAITRKKEMDLLLDKSRKLTEKEFSIIIY
jgi:hypothetical protein